MNSRSAGATFCHADLRHGQELASLEASLGISKSGGVHHPGRSAIHTVVGKC